MTVGGKTTHCQHKEPGAIGDALRVFLIHKGYIEWTGIFMNRFLQVHLKPQFWESALTHCQPVLD